MGVDQLTAESSSSGQKDLVFVKSLDDDTEVSIPGVERPWLSEAEGFILPNHDTGRILPTESQRNTTDPSVAVNDSSATEYDSADESSVCSILVNFCDEKGISINFSSPYTSEQNGVAEKKNRTLIESARTMLSRSVFSKQYWTEAVATACYTQNRFTIVKRHLKTPYEIFPKRIPNINFLHVFGCPVSIHNHKDHLGKFDEIADDGYLLGYLLVSKAFRVFNKRRQQTEETYHITFDESPNAIKFSKPSVDNINIA
ncbi:retrovirus-related pol polyprotein from transposon TNT 1-94 [Tanacetum coccineum]